MLWKLGSVDPSQPSLVQVRGSPVLELNWLLFKLSRAYLDGLPPEVPEDLVYPQEVVDEVGSFWGDGNFEHTEWTVLAHWAQGMYAADPTLLFPRLPEILATARIRELGLATEFSSGEGRRRKSNRPVGKRPPSLRTIRQPH